MGRMRRRDRGAQIGTESDDRRASRLCRRLARTLQVAASPGDDRFPPAQCDRQNIEISAQGDVYDRGPEAGLGCWLACVGRFRQLPGYPPDCHMTDVAELFGDEPRTGI